MPEYKPPARVMALAARVKGVPIAHALLPDGCIVIVFEDGRKLTFAPVPASKPGKGK